LRKLEKCYGSPRPPRVKNALEMVLWENVAYLADDERRAAAFALLKKNVGLRPQQILAAPREALVEVGRFGIVPFITAKKLHRIAETAHHVFKDDVDDALTGDNKSALKALQRFPSIGVPGAEKILMSLGRMPVLALDSNAMRVLLRLGFGEERKNYAASYRSAQEAAMQELPAKTAELTRAYHLLRRHGQEICRRTRPACETCPVRATCTYFVKNSVAARAN
jgi:endonuclease III